MFWFVSNFNVHYWSFWWGCTWSLSKQQTTGNFLLYKSQCPPPSFIWLHPLSAQHSWQRAHACNAFLISWCISQEGFFFLSPVAPVIDYKLLHRFSFSEIMHLSTTSGHTFFHFAAQETPSEHQTLTLSSNINIRIGASLYLHCNCVLFQPVWQPRVQHSNLCPLVPRAESNCSTFKWSGPWIVAILALLAALPVRR